MRQSNTLRLSALRDIFRHQDPHPLLAGAFNSARVAVRCDSKLTVEQLLGISQIRDSLMRRILAAVKRLITKMRYTIIFDHLERSCNIAGLLLEWKRSKAREQMADIFGAHMLAPIPLLNEGSFDHFLIHCNRYMTDSTSS